ncbi:MAG: glycosyltransferase family 4 protein [Pseudomonadota bacterium]
MKVRSPGTRLKIGVVVPKYGLVGGAENFVFELTERLAAYPRFEIHVFANRWRIGAAPVTFHKVPIVAFPRWARPVSFAWFADRAIRRVGCDLIHSHDRLSRMDVLTFHGVPHAAWIRATKRPWLSLFDRAVAGVERRGLMRTPCPLVLTVSGLVKQELLKIYPLPEDRVRIVHPGVDTARYDAISRPAARTDVRRRHGWPEDAVVALFVSMNFELKRLDLVLKALAHLVRRPGGGALRLLVAGKGDAARFAAMARQLGVADRVIFAGVRRDLPELYRAADMCLLPSRFDTFGLVVLEAMAAGIPVVITDRVGARDLVVDRVNGFVLPVDPPPETLAAAMGALLDEGTRCAMGKANRAAAGRLSWDAVAGEVAALYDELVNPAGGAPEAAPRR